MTLFVVQQLYLHHLGPLDLILQACECLGLQGDSGAGKTLLLRALADLEPARGTILLEGVERNRIAPTQWRRQVQLVPAESQWWGECVGDHFSHIDNTLLQALGFAEDVMDWEVARLSSGERQRLALLRSLALNPRVLLLDEPTANLDDDNTRKVEKLITDYQRHAAAGIIWVSHDSAQLQRVAQRRARLNQGQLHIEDAV